MRYLILMLLLIPVVYAETQDFNSTYSKYGWYPEENMFINWDGLRYQLTDFEGVRVLGQDGKKILTYGTGITATYNNQTFIRTEEDYIWSYKYYTELVNFSSWEIDPNNDTNLILINYTMTQHVFERNNNNDQLNWTEKYTFNPRDDAKITHTITNNFNNVTNAKFWYILKNPKVVNFNGQLYNTSAIDVSQQGDFNNVVSRIGFRSGTFLYDDLIDSNYDLVHIYLGDGSPLGYENKRFMGLGFTKGNGRFNKGQSVVLDPSSTGFTDPIGHSDPQNQWTNPGNLLSSDDTWATETTNLNNFTLDWNFDINENANITGIQIKSEGHGYAIFCPPKYNGKFTGYLSVDNGTTEGSSFYVFSHGCISSHLDNFQTQGSSTDTWGLGVINGTSMNASNFRLRGSETGLVTVYIDNVKANVYWELLPPSITPLDPTPLSNSTISSTYTINILSNYELTSAIWETNQSGTKVNHTMNIYATYQANIVMDGEFEGANNGINFDGCVYAFSGGSSGTYCIENLTVDSDLPSVILNSPGNGSTQTEGSVTFNLTNTDNEGDNIDIFLINNFNGTIDIRNYFYYEESLSNYTDFSYNLQIGSINVLDPALYMYLKLDGESRFNETGNSYNVNVTNFVDYSIYTNGQVLHTPDYGINCLTQKCLYFDGTSDNIVLEEGTGFEVGSIIQGGNFTVSAWLYDHSTATNFYFGKGATLSGTKYLQLSQTNTVGSFALVNSSDDDLCRGTATGLSTNTWHHILYTANTTHLETYVDGVQVDYDSCNFSINASRWVSDGSSYEVYLGALGSSGTAYEWYGRIDEFILLNRSMNSNEVEMLYNVSRNPFNWTARLWQSPNETDYDYSFTTTITDPCIPPLTSYVWDSLSCNYTDAVDFEGNNFTINGTGSLVEFRNNVTNIGRGSLIVDLVNNGLRFTEGFRVIG